MGERNERGDGRQRRPRNDTGYEPALDGLWLYGRRLKPGIVLLNYTGRGDDVVPVVVEARGDG